VEILNAELLQFSERDSEIFFPTSFILSVEFNPRYHLFVNEECNVSRKHNNSGLVIGDPDLEAIVLLLGIPLHLDEVDEVCVIKSKCGSGPGANEATPVSVTHTNGMSTR